MPDEISGTLKPARPRSYRNFLLDLPCCSMIYVLISIKFYVLNIMIIYRNPYMSSLVILVAIHSASRFPYTILSKSVHSDKSSFINTDKTCFLITRFWRKRHYKTCACYIKFVSRHRDDQPSG